MSDLEYFENVVGPVPRDPGRYVANTMARAADTIDTALAAHIEAMADFADRFEAALERLGGLLDRVAAAGPATQDDSSRVLRRDVGVGHPGEVGGDGPSPPRVGA